MVALLTGAAGVHAASTRSTASSGAANTRKRIDRRTKCRCTKSPRAVTFIAFVPQKTSRLMAAQAW
ncbi:hypothetical protein XI07_28250 [Bradyrhizobium sp. CCBAU 11445]|nr:hypothetical protein [Bradyrhizobium sp. CCBAU 11445]